MYGKPVPRRGPVTAPGWGPRALALPLQAPAGLPQDVKEPPLPFLQKERSSTTQLLP